VSFFVSTATTLGSLMITPLPFIKTRVLAVPRSMPTSLLNPNIDYISFDYSIYNKTILIIKSKIIIPQICGICNLFHHFLINNER
jgi:hypothetical protein